MRNEQTGLPQELSGFSISRDCFKEILQERIADDISSIEIDGEEAELTVPLSYLRRVVGGKYGEEIGELEFKNGEVTVWKSDPSRGEEGNEE